MRQQQGYRAGAEDLAGNAAKKGLAPRPMAVAAHNQDIGVGFARSLKQ
ncbi:MAG TPA: hypothetical protein VND87_05430 [Stellaceae bacterium]|nr:hypothetical protein [Stellaceae bacterium]